MNILILGSGGREHAFAHSIANSQKCEKLYVAPGNAGTSLVAQNINISVNDFTKIYEFVLNNQIHMVVVGPEDPLVAGIYDYFQQHTDLQDVLVVGPSKQGAALEGSKDFAKQFLIKNNIPTGQYQTFTAKNLYEGYAFLETLKPPYVLKADGLAAGKGVLIIKNLEEAKAELRNMLVEAKFGEASQKVVIEEFLDGIELSCFVLTDGKSYKILPTAKDYKRIGEGDTGLNTGGMGAVSPVPFADDVFMKKIEEDIVKPTIKGLNEANIVYRGFIFIGLIKVNNNPYVIEYNVRMGDPETEVVLPRIKSDLVDLLYALKDQTLEQQTLDVSDKTATTVVLVSGGYPEDYQKGKEILGLNHPNESIIFHAGTKTEDNKVLTNGGRVLAITSFGNSIAEAKNKSYETIQQISFEGMYYRKDLGQDLM